MLNNMKEKLEQLEKILGELEEMDSNMSAMVIVCTSDDWLHCVRGGAREIARSLANAMGNIEHLRDVVAATLRAYDETMQEIESKSKKQEA
jgi:hypothetical protein